MIENEVKEEPHPIGGARIKKFHIKDYQGERVRVPVPGAMNIRKIYKWSKLLKKYTDPPRGGKYEAIRAKRTGEGRETAVFDFIQDAKDWQAGRNLIAENVAENIVKPKDGYMVEDLLNDWQRIAWPTLRESTRLYYSNRIIYFAPLFGIKVDDLNPKIIDEWLTALKQPKQLELYKSNRYSFLKELEILKTMVHWHIETNDSSKLVSPFKKRHSGLAMLKEKPAEIAPFMTTEEFEKWLICLKDYSPMFWLMGLTQQKQVFRIGEVAAMRWSNLDLKNKVYRMTEHVIWPRVKGREPYLAPGTKTNKSGEIFISHLRKEVLTALTEWELTKKADLIFSDDGKILTYRQIQYVFNLAFKRAGLPYSSTHVLRHTGATEFLEMTGDTLALQQMGNWKDQNQALHYGKILSSRAKNAIEKLENHRVLKLVRSDDGSKIG